MPLFKDSTGKPGLDQKITQKVDRGAAQAGPLRRRLRAHRGRRRSSTERSCATTPRPSGSATRRVAHAGHPLRHHLTARVRYAKVGAGRAHLGQRLVLVPRRIRRGLRPVRVLRPRGAGRGAPGHVVRAQPGGRDAGGVLTPPEEGARLRRRRSRHRRSRHLPGRAGARGAARGLGRRRPRGLRPGPARRRDDLGPRDRGGAHGIAVRVAPRGRGARGATASRAKATSCPPISRTRARTRASSSWPLKPDKRRSRSGSACSRARRSHSAEPLKGRAARGYVADQVRRRKLALSDEAFEELFERVGQDLRRLMGELEKLEAFAQGARRARWARRRSRPCSAGAWPSRSTGSATRSRCAAARRSSP